LVLEPAADVSLQTGKIESKVYSMGNAGRIRWEISMTSTETTQFPARQLSLAAPAPEPLN